MMPGLATNTMIGEYLSRLIADVGGGMGGYLGQGLTSPAQSARPGSMAQWAWNAPTLKPQPFPMPEPFSVQPPTPEEEAALMGLRSSSSPTDAPAAATAAPPPTPHIFSGGKELGPGSFAGQGAAFTAQAAQDQAAGTLPWQVAGNADYGRSKALENAFSGNRPDLAAQFINTQRFATGDLANQRSAQVIQQSDPAYQRAQVVPNALAKAQGQKAAYRVERGTAWDQFIDRVNQELNPRYQGVQENAAKRGALPDLMRSMTYGNLSLDDFRVLMGMLGMAPQVEPGQSMGKTMTSAEVAAAAREAGVDASVVQQQLEAMGYRLVR